MPAGPPTVIESVALAFRDLVRALGTLSGLAVVAFLVIVAADIVQAAFIAGDPLPTRRLLFTFILQCGRAFLLTPFFIAVHRFIILGEQAPGYVLAPREPRFQMFFGWLLAFEVLSHLPLFVIQMFPGTSPGRLTTMFALMLAITIVMLRLTILFPAIATESPGATLQNAMADTRGHVWRIFFVTVLVLLVVLVPVLVVARLIGSTGEIGLTPLGAFNAVANGALGLVMLTLLIAIASRFYLWIGIRTQGP